MAKPVYVVKSGGVSGIALRGQRGQRMVIESLGTWETHRSGIRNPKIAQESITGGLWAAGSRRG